MEDGRATLLTVFARRTERTRISIVDGGSGEHAASPLVAVADGSWIDWVRGSHEAQGDQAPLSVYRVDETDALRETAVTGDGSARWQASTLPSCGV